MLETISSVVFLLIIVIIVALAAPKYVGWVIGAILATALFRLLDKK